MAWFQKSLQLRARTRGCHLITAEIEQGLRDFPVVRCGLLHLFLQHTSASLTINENADSDVRRDLREALDRLAPEDAPYAHTLEGADDMPAHIKSTLTGVSLTIPVRDGQLGLGTWQGVYLCEHRDRGGPRTVVATLHGEVVAAP